MHDRIIVSLVIVAEVHFPGNPLTPLDKLFLFGEVVYSGVDDVVSREPETVPASEARTAEGGVHSVHAEPGGFGGEDPVGGNAEDFSRRDMRRVVWR
jgi:hypothetical protein